MNNIYAIAHAFIILMLVGLAVHQVSLWLDFEWPKIQEARAKKKALQKYGLDYHKKNSFYK
jgi:hypothetical protein